MHLIYSNTYHKSLDIEWVHEEKIFIIMYTEK